MMLSQKACQAPKWHAEWNNIIKYIKDLLACHKIKPKKSGKIDALSPIDQYDQTKQKNSVAGIMKLT